MTKSQKTWISEFKRKVVSADFNIKDHVPEFTPGGWSPVSSSKSYLAATPAGRFRDRFFRVVALLMYGFVVFAMVVGWPDIMEGASLWIQIAAVLLGLYGLWMVLINQGYLRWMHRNRKAPRRKS